MHTRAKFYKNPHLTSPALDISLNVDQTISDADWEKVNLTEFIKSQTLILLRSIKKNREKDHSFYTGISGIIFSLRKLAIFFQDRDKELAIKIESAIENGIGHIYPEIASHKKDPPSFLLGSLAPNIVKFEMTKEAEKKSELLAKIENQTIQYSNHVCDLKNESEIPDDILYGRAGFLHSLLYLDMYLPKTTNCFIDRVCDAIIKRGYDLITPHEFRPKLNYSWHACVYLGAAHGLSGIYYLLLDQPCLSSPSVQSRIYDIKSSADDLFKIIDQSGNLPSSYGKDALLVQWCHGAPGAIYLAIRCHKIFKDVKYMKIAEKFVQVIWEKGILIKSIGLCHGVSGNAYAFLAMYNYTFDNIYLYYAYKFAEWIVENSQLYNSPDRPTSLYEGLAGVLYFLIDLNHPCQAMFPGYQTAIDRL